jgi:hypothetical protein
MPVERKTDKTSEAVADAQKRRFIETAKELEADETGEEFERMFAKAVPTKKRRLQHSALVIQRVPKRFSHSAPVYLASHGVYTTGFFPRA